MADLDLSVVAFVMAIYAAAVVTPGPSFLFMSRLSLQGRRTQGMGATVGIAFATTVYALLAMTGLAWLLDQTR
jgi:threonine/homoserine/homoserine lactone efflux protein